LPLAGESKLMRRYGTAAKTVENLGCGRVAKAP